MLVVDGMDGAVRLPDASPATLPWHNSRMGDQCPLQRLRVDTGDLPACLWVFSTVSIHVMQLSPCT